MRSTQQGGDGPVVTIGNVPVSVTVAATPQAREQGLSGAQPLRPGQGMLFVFPAEGKQGFWMKDMNYPLDIIWADASGSVVTIWRDLSPATYPQAFYPTEPALYVLEVPAGFAEQNGIATGTIMRVPPSVPPAGQ